MAHQQGRGRDEFLGRCRDEELFGLIGRYGLPRLNVDDAYPRRGVCASDGEKGYDVLGCCRLPHCQE